MGKVSFSIQEYTQGSKKKYMVLILDIRKYTPAEQKSINSKGKVKFTMKPVN